MKATDALSGQWNLYCPQGKVNLQKTRKSCFEFMIRVSRETGSSSMLNKIANHICKHALIAFTSTASGNPQAIKSVWPTPSYAKPYLRQFRSIHHRRARNIPNTGDPVHCGDLKVKFTEFTCEQWLVESDYEHDHENSLVRKWHQPLAPVMWLQKHLVVHKWW